MTFRALFLAAALVPVVHAANEPLSRGFQIDFFRDIPSRNLKGMATRSDGRLLTGPALRDLNGPALPELLWCLEPRKDGRWLIGTGPDGRIVEVTLASPDGGYTVREVVDLEEPQVLALKELPNGDLLAGTSPNGVLALISDGKVAAEISLPVDSIFDIVVRDDRAYVATGNPGRIYEVALPTFRSAGVTKDKLRQAVALQEKGVRLFAEVRDRNVRRIAWLGERLVAGSSPKGNVYAFAATGGAPELLQENRDAEVAALLPQPNGDLFAAIVFAASPAENRISRPTPPKAEGTDAPAAPPPPAAPSDRFPGRSSIVYFPANGFPETVVTRANLAFYALARRGPLLLISGGEQGDLLGYDTVARQSLSFAGSDSAQLNALVPLPAAPGARRPGGDRFLALRNNAPGLAVIDFGGDGPRSAETRRLDLGLPATLGALRIARTRHLGPEDLKVDLRGNLGSDEIEGWGPWTPMERRPDGWRADNARARNVRLRLTLAPEAREAVELDDPTLFHLPQNRRPLLTEFRVLPGGYTLLPAPEPVPPVVTTLSQLIASADRDDKRRNALLGSQVMPQPGMQIVTWTLTDPDNDNLASTFAIRREGSEAWQDLAVATQDAYVQFNTTHLEDGIYATRLTVAEQDPRPADQRVTAVFETDDIVVDNTAPVVVDVTVTRETAGLRLSATGRDAFSLMQGAEFAFNNGSVQIVTQPQDGIRDSQTETFSALVPAAQAALATSVEVTLYDEVGNASAVRVALKP